MRAENGQATRESLRKAAQELAETSFEHHKVKQLGPGYWWCGRTTSSAYGFYVVALHYAVLVYGDIGELFLEIRDQDPLPWLKGCLGREGGAYHDYPLGKARGAERAFLRGEARQVLAEMDAELGDRARRPERIRALWEDYEEEVETAEAWRRAYYEVTGDPEVPKCTYWSFQALFRLEALRWFTRRALVPGAVVDDRPAPTRIPGPGRPRTPG